MKQINFGHFAFFLLFSIFVLASESEDMKCNGHAELCERTLLEVALASSHNSMSNKDDGWFAPDNEHGILEQLEFGIRALTLDILPYRHGIYLCHKICETGNKYFFDGLMEIKVFLDENPHELVLIFFETRISNAETADYIREAGLDKLAFSYDSEIGWPTLRQMIVDNKRLVLMSDGGDFEGAPSWIHDAYDLAAYSGPVWNRNASGDGLDRNAMDCWSGHIRGQPQKLYWLNHFGLAPFTLKKMSESINFNPYFFERVQGCWDEAGHMPNIVSVTFYESSDVLSVVDSLNGVER